MAHRPHRWRRWLLRGFAAIAVFVAAVLLWNASFWAPALSGTPKLIAHRGVHQTFDREGIESDTCTAERIFSPEHEFFENTIASMQAAFAAGARVVELDVAATTDGQLAVFHDWTLECRTEGSGEIRGHDMAYLKTLDVGYGYTADGGQTFPLRGKGVGLMPNLAEVFAQLPEGQFIINYKSRDAGEGDMVAALVADHPEWTEAVWGTYGGAAPTMRLAENMPGVRAWTSKTLVNCLGQYIGYGWTGIMPAACTDATVMVPINVAPWLWGWPNRFMQRFEDVGATVILIGPIGGPEPGTSGIDDIETASTIPDGFPGYVWTNKIEVIGPALTR